MPFIMSDSSQLSPLPHVTANALHNRPLKYYDFMMAAFVVILVLSNVIGAAKMAQVNFPIFGTRVFGAGIMFFPLGYLLGDILTEVYGYARARRCIWAGFGALAFMVLMATVVVALPPEPHWALDARPLTVLGQTVTAPNQAAYEMVFGQEWRIALASLVAFWAGEFVNSFVLARMKVLTKGTKLWTRTIGSTVCGQFVDSLVFYPLAFLGAQGWTTEGVISVMITNWTMKVCWEVLLTPLTYAIVNFLKRTEGLDVYDEGTNFTPFRTAV